MNVTVGNHSPPHADRAPGVGWAIAEWGLFAVWIADAALVMTHRQAGFFTSHAADITMPAWLYVVRRRSRRPGSSRLRRLITPQPPVLALLLFTASTATELMQLFWPDGPFPGVFDPFDILAYAVGVGACFAADRRWPIPSRGSPLDGT